MRKPIKACILKKAAKAAVFKPGQLVWVGDSVRSAFRYEIVEFVREGGWAGNPAFAMLCPVGSTSGYMQSVKVAHLSHPTPAQLRAYKAKKV